MSNENDAWGANSYNENDDAVRLQVSPTFVEENQEELSYSITNEGISVAWEKVRLLIPIK